MSKKIPNSILKKSNIVMYKSFFMKEGETMLINTDMDFYTFDKAESVKVLLRSQPERHNLQRFINSQVSTFVVSIDSDHFDKDTVYNEDGITINYSIETISKIMNDIELENAPKKFKIEVVDDMIENLDYEFDIKTEIATIKSVDLVPMK